MRGVWTVLVFQVICAGMIVADMPPLPDEAERGTAPDLPHTRDMSTVQHCEPLSEATIRQYFAPDGAEAQWETQQQLDLNEDGWCEAFVARTDWCGTGGCPLVIPQRLSDEVHDIGMVFGWDVTRIYEPYHGYVQIELWSKSGQADITFAIYQFAHDRYTEYRIDHYHANAEEWRFVFDHAEYPAHDEAAEPTPHP
jgi:hypothetical protein